MEALRIILRQTSANYRKEETVNNKMTYPLPPVSTVIGAIHKACNYTEYKEMKISIQGKYESMHKEPYKNFCFLNSTMDDRGILVKMKDGNKMSSAYEVVAESKKSQGNSFRKGISIKVINAELLDEYRRLLQKRDEIKERKQTELKPQLDKIKEEKKSIADKKKAITKGSEEYLTLVQQEKNLKDKEKQINDKFKEYEQKEFIKPYSNFRSLTTSLKYYEILDEITLIIHVAAEPDILKNIEDNIWNLKSIGRSEDFVDIQSVKRVELLKESDRFIKSKNSAYLDLELVRNGYINPQTQGRGREANGTKYILNRDYKVQDGRRIFNKCKVIYMSGYKVGNIDGCENLYIDSTDDKYIVNLL